MDKLTFTLEEIDNDGFLPRLLTKLLNIPYEESMKIRKENT